MFTFHEAALATTKTYKQIHVEKFWYVDSPGAYTGFYCVMCNVHITSPLTDKNVYNKAYSGHQKKKSK